MLKFVVLFFICNLSYAGNSVGNGGDVVLCPQSTELLDLYEAKELYKRNLITSNEDYKSIINERLSNLGKLSPALESLYLKKLNSYKIAFKKDIVLKDLKDENHVFIPKNCSLKQIAHRINESGPAYDIIINDDYWKKLSNVNQAGLIMHEVIYDHFRFFKVINSSGVRKFIGIIYSDDFKNFTKEDLKKLFLELKIPLD